ncbi:MAG: hypothetical protein KGI09_07240 [Thaumarchaeota archaeon]|nr:hypothetical protein [Nitrososphaerota archaeon]
MNYGRIRIGDLCSHCKKGRMELHYSAKGIKFGEKSTPPMLWKCDNQECMFILQG